MPDPTKPPKGALLLLSIFRSEPDFPQIEGDLSEEFHQLLLNSGTRAAQRWYWREALRNLWVFSQRPSSLLVFVLGAFCVLTFRFTPPILMSLMRDKLSLMPRGLLLVLFQVSCGFALGILVSLMVKGGERILRLSFAGLCTVWLAHTIFYLWQHSAPLEHFTLHLRDVFWPGQVFFRFSCAVISFWLGSLWVEWRNRRQIIC